MYGKKLDQNFLKTGGTHLLSFGMQVFYMSLSQTPNAAPKILIRSTIVWSQAPPILMSYQYQTNVAGRKWLAMDWSDVCCLGEWIVLTSILPFFQTPPVSLFPWPALKLYVGLTNVEVTNSLLPTSESISHKNLHALFIVFAWHVRHFVTWKTLSDVRMLCSNWVIPVL